MGEQVMHNTKHLTGYQHELMCRFIGPFSVNEVRPGTVHLQLPTHMKVHDRVNVDKVKRYTPSAGEWPVRRRRAVPCRCASATTGRGSGRWRPSWGGWR